MTESRRPRRKQEERSALSERLLMEAAIELFLERGMEGTTLAGIAERSGYSRGLVSHRFGSKSGLITAIHDSVSTWWREQVSAAVGDRVGLAAVMSLIEGLDGFVKHSPKKLRAMHVLRYSSVDPGAQFRESVAKTHHAQIRDVQRWIEGGKATGEIAADFNSRLFAEWFCGLLDGLMYRWHVNPEFSIHEVHQLVRQQLPLLLELAPGETAAAVQRGAAGPSLASPASATGQA